MKRLQLFRLSVVACSLAASLVLVGCGGADETTVNGSVAAGPGAGIAAASALADGGAPTPGAGSPSAGGASDGLWCTEPTTSAAPTILAGSATNGGAMLSVCR